MNAPVKIEEKNTLRGLARQALKAAGGDTKLAADALSEQLENDKALFRGIVADAVVIASYIFVEETMRSRRHTIANGAHRATRADAEALARGIRSSVLDFPLTGGLKLRDATPDQVTEQIERYDAIGRDVTHKSRWLRLIVQSVPRDKKIGDVISDDRAQELWSEASK